MKRLLIALAMLLPALALATGTATDQITMKPQASPTCTASRACIYGKSGTDRVYIADSAGLELQSNAARMYRTAVDCTALSSPANGDVCYSSGLTTFQYYVAGWTSAPVNDALLLHKTGTETASGDKTFSGALVVTGTVTSSVLAFNKVKGGAVGVLTAATVYLTAPGQAKSTTEVYLDLGTRTAAIRRMFCYLGTAPGGSDTVVFTARVSASDSALTCTISAAGQTCNSSSLSDVDAAGNGLSIKAVSSAGTAADATCSFEETYS